MMQFLRKHMKWIFLVVALCFLATIFFVWGMGNTDTNGENNVLAVAGGEKIRVAEFERKWSDVIQANNIDEANMPAFQAILFKKQVLNEMIFDVLINKYISSGAIKLTDDDRELVKLYIKAICTQQYKTDYTSLDANGFKTVENMARNYVLRLKLKSSIQEQVKLSNTEITEEFLKKNEQRKFKYINIDAAKFASLTAIGINDAKNYFDTNKLNFKTQEKYKIEVVSGDISLDKAKQLAADATKKNDLLAASAFVGLKAGIVEFSLYELIPGVDFDASEDIKKFLKNCPAGEVSAPVKARKGYVIARFLEKLPAGEMAFDSVKGAIENKLKTDKSVPLAETEGNKIISELMTGKNFEQAATGYKTATTDFVKSTDTLKTVDDYSYLLNGGFTIPKTGGARTVKHNGGCFVVQLVDVKQPTQEQFNKDVEAIKKNMTESKQKAFEGEFAGWLRKKYKVVDNSDKIFNKSL